MTVIVVEAPLSERARRATAEAKKLLPSWAAFARMLARRSDLTVKLTGGTPCTDGDTVFLRVPIELGDEVPHDKPLCSQRGADKNMLCPACRVLDHVSTTIFHEIAHIIHGSFEEVPEKDRLRLVDDAIRLEYADDAGRAAKIRKKVESKRDWIDNWMKVASLVSPYLPMLLNAIEDVWVNAEMMDARPGTRVMFSAQTTDVFENGIQQDDGEVIKWSDQPLNAQAVIGVYCQGSNLEYDSWLDPKVVEDLQDPEIRGLIHRIKTSRSAKARYRLSIQILEALRRLGYLLSEEDADDDEPDPGEGEPEESTDETGDEDGPSTAGDAFGDGASGDDDESDDDGSEGGDTPDEESFRDDGLDTGKKASPKGERADANESDDDGDDEADAEGNRGEGDIEAEDGDDDESSPGDGTHGTSDKPMGDPGEVEDLFKVFGRHEGEDDPPTREDREIEREVDRAINQGEHFDKPSDNLVGVEIHRADDGENHPVFGHGLPVAETPETILAPSLAKLRIAFSENHKGKHQRNLKKGRRLDRKTMGRRIPTDDPRLFSRRVLPGKRDYFVVIGLDISGSTGAGLINLIKQAGAAQAELLSRLRVPFAMYCHSGSSEGLEIFEIKGPNEPWSDKQKEALDRVGSFWANLDGHTLEFYRKRAEEHRATDKLIMYYTDGAMPAENFHEELEVLKRNIELCKQHEVNLVAIGVRNDDPIQYGLDTIRLDTMDDLPKVVEGLGERLA